MGNGISLFKQAHTRMTLVYHSTSTRAGSSPISVQVYLNKLLNSESGYYSLVKKHGRYFMLDASKLQNPAYAAMPLNQRNKKDYSLPFVIIEVNGRLELRVGPTNHLFLAFNSSKMKALIYAQANSFLNTLYVHLTSKRQPKLEAYLQGSVIQEALLQARPQLVDLIKNYFSRIQYEDSQILELRKNLDLCLKKFLVKELSKVIGDEVLLREEYLPPVCVAGNLIINSASELIAINDQSGGFHISKGHPQYNDFQRSFRRCLAMVGLPVVLYEAYNDSAPTKSNDTHIKVIPDDVSNDMQDASVCPTPG